MPDTRDLTAPGLLAVPHYAARRQIEPTGRLLSLMESFADHMNSSVIYVDELPAPTAEVAALLVRDAGSVANSLGVLMAYLAGYRLDGDGKPVDQLAVELLKLRRLLAEVANAARRTVR